MKVIVHDLAEADLDRIAQAARPTDN